MKEEILEVFCGNAIKEPTAELTKKFQEKTGCTVHFTYGTVGSLVEKLNAGQVADVIILTTELAKKLAEEKRVIGDTIAEVGKTGVGIAARKGSKIPDISTVEALRQALLVAKTIAYVDPAKGATSGIHFANVLEKLGIADDVKEKSILLSGGYVIEFVAEGKAELGVQQITEILPVQGATLVGPLPPELQKITTYAASVVATTATNTLAADFVRFITCPEAEPIFNALGFGRY